jgi:hypothetical protein
MPVIEPPVMVTSEPDRVTPVIEPPVIVASELDSVTPVIDPPVIEVVEPSEKMSDTFTQAAVAPAPLQ